MAHIDDAACGRFNWWDDVELGPSMTCDNRSIKYLIILLTMTSIMAICSWMGIIVMNGYEIKTMKDRISAIEQKLIINDSIISGKHPA